VTATAAAALGIALVITILLARLYVEVAGRLATLQCRRCGRRVRTDALNCPACGLSLDRPPLEPGRRSHGSPG
jgi:predicted amidophosphoribosyltransferase